VNTAGPDLRAAAGGELARRLSPRYLEEHALLPLDIGADGALRVAAGAPLHPTVLDELARLYGATILVVDVPRGEIQAAILAVTRDRSPETPAIAATQTSIATDDLRALANEAPVVQLVNVTLLDALRAGASDVHLESRADGLRVRLRLDGVLHDSAMLPAQYRAAVVSRVKIMAGLDISERRTSQDGRARVRLGNREVDLRVSTLPALHGESVVLRILDHGVGRRALTGIGMPDDVRARLERVIERPSGMVLVTGPTGSGKTTTLYGAIDRLNVTGVKVISIEDPVEYQIPGVTQIPVNPRAGFDFPNALRSILRHDPDVVMVGEMRDRATVELAIQASLTGHRVLSTLHTNDAVSGIVRLADMGVEPYLVAATVQAILAQRLVRVLCACASHGEPVGCAVCAHSGYRGRTGIYELLVVTDAFRDLVSRRAPLAELRAHAAATGMTTLRDAGMAAAHAGVTTLAEVLRVTGDAEPVT
jgi:type II secretory ATPase GspE/PulE/Tfp pilus assembly ATPase PilB-like protein